MQYYLEFKICKLYLDALSCISVELFDKQRLSALSCGIRFTINVVTGNGLASKIEISAISSFGVFGL